MSRRGTIKVGTGTIGDALAWLRKSKALHEDAMTAQGWAYEASSMWLAAEPIIKAYVNQLPVDASEEIARLTRERDAARAECRAWAVLDRTRSMFERYLLSPRGPTAADVRAAEEALTKARAANQMENTQ